MDVLSRTKRSENMRRIRSRDTSPELALQALIRSLGIAYRKHADNLPGRPDLVFLKHRKAIFIHGCFWHLHGRCKTARIPKTRRSYWVPKLEGNKKRDIRIRAKLRKLGWAVLTIWECQMSDSERIRKRVSHFLSPNPERTQ